jgi:hypothetical protein
MGLSQGQRASITLNADQNRDLVTLRRKRNDCQRKAEGYYTMSAAKGTRSHTICAETIHHVNSMTETLTKQQLYLAKGEFHEIIDGCDNTGWLDSHDIEDL